MERDMLLESTRQMILAKGLLRPSCNQRKAAVYSSTQDQDVIHLLRLDAYTAPHVLNSHM